MHLGDVGRGGDLAGADRPDRLVGDDQLALLPIVGERAGELRLDPRDMAAGGALGFRFADADDRDQPALQRRDRLGADRCVALLLLGAALAMAADDQPGARLPDHRHRDAAGMGAACPPRGNPARR